MSRSLIPTTDQSRGDPMAGLFQMSKAISFPRLWITGLLGALLSIFAGNATAYCEFDSETRTWICFHPFVSMTSPANGATYTLPASFPVTATVDNSGQAIAITKVDF